MYTDPVYFLNMLLDDLGQEQDADSGAWAYDRVRAGEWFTANHVDDGRLVQAYVDHVSADACGYSGVELSRPFGGGNGGDGPRALKRLLTF